MNQDITVREHVHIQKHPFKFHAKPYAGGKFGTEVSAYVTGDGWEELDATVSGNAFMIHYYKFLRDQEMLGYEHIGISADELKTKLETMWNKKEEDWE